MQIWDYNSNKILHVAAFLHSFLIFTVTKIIAYANWRKKRRTIHCHSKGFLLSFDPQEVKRPQSPWNLHFQLQCGPFTSDWASRGWRLQPALSAWCCALLHKCSFSPSWMLKTQCWRISFSRRVLEWTLRRPHIRRCYSLYWRETVHVYIHEMFFLKEYLNTRDGRA